MGAKFVAVTGTELVGWMTVLPEEARMRSMLEKPRSTLSRMEAKFVAVMRVELVGWMMVLQEARMRVVMTEEPRLRAVWVAGSEKICPGKKCA
jgi:hypothetical protein